MRKREGWVALLVTGAGFLRLGWWLRSPDEVLVNAIPDDAFYYLQLARNFALTGRWSFDGTEPASGFHLLWGYFLAGVYRVAPGIALHPLYTLLGLVEIGCMALAAWLAVRVAVRLSGAGAELGVAVTFLSALSLTVTGDLMEFGPVVLVAALLAELLTADGATERLSLLAGLGVLGVLARSDFGLLPLCLLIAMGAWWRRGGGSGRRVRQAGAALAGAAGGEALVLLHTHWISGGWVQTSARQKLFWSGLAGYSLEPVKRLLLRTLNGSADLGWHTGAGNRVARVLALLIAAGVCWALRPGAGQARERIWMGAMLASVAGYALLYRYNSGALQMWYLANFEVPLALLAGCAFAVLARRLPRGAVALAGVLCVWGVAGSNAGHTTEPGELYRAGMYLREHPELRPMGAWNAGMIGYFSGGGVTNLDGLVNDRIYPYARDGKLLDYVEARGIKTLIDFPTMLDPDAMERWGPDHLRERGGYADGQLQGCVRLERMVGAVGIYRVECGPGR